MGIKKKKSYRYLVFYIKDEKVIQVEKVGDRNADYQEFLQDLRWGTRRLQVRSVRLRVHAPVPGNDRGVEEGEALLDLVVPGQRQDQEEDALLILFRRPEKVPGRSAEVHTGH